MKEEILKFTNWIKLKIRLHISQDVNFYFKERDIWWVSWGANVGVEMEGKNSNFERPILVVKKFSKDMLWALPITSKHKEDKYHQTLTHAGQDFSIVLSQLRTISSKRLLRKSRSMLSADFEIVRKRLKELI